ncbi:MAG: type I restriction enzyme HsdR N-terminal domain-containing protein [Bacteroidota bacterium]|nr:type I restriction enzyme HsdR N-terminal domain-containing protein [Bacteroidota bacterium]
MQKLNLPPYEFRLRKEGEQVQIFDSIRKKFLVLNPEEWVRQNFLQFLIIEKKFPASLIVIESGLKYNQLRKRSDVLAYDRSGKPYLLVECKAPEVKITQDAFDQVARYNMQFKVKFLVVTNGLNHFCCEMDYEAGTWKYLPTVPEFE